MFRISMFNALSLKARECVCVYVSEGLLVYQFKAKQYRGNLTANKLHEVML